MCQYHSDQDQADATQEEESPAFSGANVSLRSTAMSDALAFFENSSNPLVPMA